MIGPLIIIGGSTAGLNALTLTGAFYQPGWSIDGLGAGVWQVAYQVPGSPSVVSFGFATAANTTPSTWRAATVTGATAVLTVGIGTPFEPQGGSKYWLWVQVPTPTQTPATFLIGTLTAS